MAECIFCKIISKEIQADFIAEFDRVVAFRDIRPVAPVHILVVPRAHILSVDHLEPGHKELIGELFLLAKEIARKQNLTGAYKLVFNVGRGGGQIIDHLHLHLIGGWKNKEASQARGMP